MFRQRRRENLRLIDAMAEHYGVLPSDVVGMVGDPMERLTFDYHCYQVWLDSQPKQKQKRRGVIVGDG